MFSVREKGLGHKRSYTDTYNIKQREKTTFIGEGGTLEREYFLLTSRVPLAPLLILNCCSVAIILFQPTGQKEEIHQVGTSMTVFVSLT